VELGFKLDLAHLGGFNVGEILSNSGAIPLGACDPPRPGSRPVLEGQNFEPRP
jgi:hypothetical protein